MGYVYLLPVLGERGMGVHHKAISSSYPGVRRQTGTEMFSVLLATKSSGLG